MSTIHTITNPYLTLSVNEMGAAITQLTYLPKQFPLLYISNHPVKNLDGGLFALLPFVNRIRDNQFRWQNKVVRLPINREDEPYLLHGNGWQNTWHCTKTAGQLSFSCESKIENVCSYYAQLAFTLKNQSLILALTLTNTAAQPFLFGLGLHPFFSVFKQSIIYFSAQQMWLEDDAHLPIEPRVNIPDYFDFSRGKVLPEYWLNNGYSLGNKTYAEIIHPNGLKISLSSNAEYLQVYKPHGVSPFICLEPQTQFVNAHHHPKYDSLTQLNSGQSMQLIAEITVSQI